MDAPLNAVRQLLHPTWYPRNFILLCQLRAKRGSCAFLGQVPSCSQTAAVAVTCNVPVTNQSDSIFHQPQCAPACHQAAYRLTAAARPVLPEEQHLWLARRCS